jgi:hypothetical protein
MYWKKPFFLLKFIFFYEIFVFYRFFAFASPSCRELGFNNEALKCQQCDSIKSVVQDETLYQECAACCISTRKDIAKYQLAVLEVDKRFLNSLPDIAAVVKKKKALNLTVRYRAGARPYLHVYYEKGDQTPADSILIVSWNQDTFEDFLKSNIVSEDSS